MAKEATKQIAITLLICIAVVLLLLLIFYQYIPSNKVMPSKVERYSMPENVKTELEKTSEEELSNTEEIFEITDNELDKQKTRKSYSSGKSDPFADYSFEEDQKQASDKDPGTGASNSDNSSSEKKETTDKNSTDNYYVAENIARSTK